MEFQCLCLSSFECGTGMNWGVRVYICQVSLFTCESHILAHSHDVQISGILMESVWRWNNKNTLNGCWYNWSAAED